MFFLTGREIIRKEQKRRGDRVEEMGKDSQGSLKVLQRKWRARNTVTQQDPARSSSLCPQRIRGFANLVEVSFDGFRFDDGA